MGTALAMVLLSGAPAALLYALAAAVLIGKFVHHEGPNKRLGLSLASVGVIAHIAFLIKYAFSYIFIIFRIWTKCGFPITRNI